MIPRCALLLLTIVWGSAPILASAAPLCLWTATKDDRTHYLLGSVHVLKPTDYPLPAPMDQAFRDSDKVIFEADIQALNSPAIQARIRAIGLLPEGEPSLYERLPTETAASLRSALAARRFPAEAFARQRPWLAAISLPLLELQRLGYTPQHGVDQHFHRRATSEGKSTGFLETPVFQLDLLSGLATEDEVALLTKALAELALAEEEFGKLLDAWRQGDIATLAEGVVGGLEEYPALRKRLFVDRNRAWIQKLERWFVADETCLVVVGAGHLVGTDSVIEMLRGAGWTIRQHGVATPVPAGR